MRPGSSVTMSPMPGSFVDGSPGLAAQTRVTRPTPSIQTLSGGPSVGSLGTATGTGAWAVASASVPGRRRPRVEPGGPAVGVGVGLAAGDDEGLAAPIDGLRTGVGVGPGPKTIRRPGRPKPIALATAAKTRIAAMARTSPRRIGRADVGQPSPSRSARPRRAGPKPAASIRSLARRAGSMAVVPADRPAAEAGTAGTARLRPRSRRASSNAASGSCASRRTSATVRPFGRGRQAIPEAPERAGQARLHRAARQSEDVGGLGLVEVEEVAGGDHRAVGVAEVVDRADEPGPLFAVEDRRLGRWGRIGRPAILGSPEGETRPPAGRAPSVPCFVGDDPQEPRPERGPITEPAERAIGLDERLLDGVLGITIGRDQVRRPHGGVLIPPDERLVGHDLASLRAGDQIVVVIDQWTALHCQT